MLKRAIGWSLDDNVGGSSFDELAAGDIPEPDKWLRVTTADVDPNENQLERANEVTGFGANVVPREFTSAPVLTFTSLAYPLLVKKLTKLWTGDTDARGGTPPDDGITHGPFRVQEGEELPAWFVWLWKDNELHQLAGLTVNQWTLDLPIDNWGTVQVSMRAKYHKRIDAEAIDPDPDISVYEPRAYLLRDARVYLAGLAEKSIGLRGLRFTFDHRMADAKFDPGANRVYTIGDDSVERTTWWPYINRRLKRQVSGQLMWDGTRFDEDVKRELAYPESLQAQLDFDSIPTTDPIVREQMIIDCENVVRTGGGADPLTDQDDINASYDFGCYINESTGEDIGITFVDDSNVDIEAD